MMTTRAPNTEAHRGSQRRLEAGGRYLRIPPKRGFLTRRERGDNRHRVSLGVQEIGCGTGGASAREAACRRSGRPRTAGSRGHSRSRPTRTKPMGCRDGLGGRNRRRSRDGESPVLRRKTYRARAPIKTHGGSRATLMAFARLMGIRGEGVLDRSLICPSYVASLPPRSTQKVIATGTLPESTPTIKLSLSLTILGPRASPPPYSLRFSAWRKTCSTRHEPSTPVAHSWDE